MGFGPKGRWAGQVIVLSFFRFEFNFEFQIQIK